MERKETQWVREQRRNLRERSAAGGDGRITCGGISLSDLCDTQEKRTFVIICSS